MSAQHKVHLNPCGELDSGLEVPVQPMFSTLMVRMQQHGALAGGHAYHLGYGSTLSCTDWRGEGQPQAALCASKRSAAAVALSNSWPKCGAAGDPGARDV